jgi:hypothetical protein
VTSAADRTLTDADVEAIATAVAEKLERRRRSRRKAPAPTAPIEMSETDRAHVRAIAKGLGLHVPRGGRDR